MCVRVSMYMYLLYDDIPRYIVRDVWSVIVLEVIASPLAILSPHQTTTSIHGQILNCLAISSARRIPQYIRVY